MAGKPLADGEMADAPTFDEAFDRFVAGAAAAKPGLPKELVRVLARRHGSGFDDVLENVNSLSDLGRAFGGHLYEAEVRYLMRDEWAWLSVTSPGAIPKLQSGASSEC